MYAEDVVIVIVIYKCPKSLKSKPMKLENKLENKKYLFYYLKNIWKCRFDM